MTLLSNINILKTITDDIYRLWCMKTKLLVKINGTAKFSVIF